MKKRVAALLLGVVCLSGCASNEAESIENTSDPVVTAVQSEEARNTTQVEETQSTVQVEEISEAATEVQTVTAEQTTFAYNDFLAEYQDDLGRISICDSDASELVDNGDVLELKNAVVSRNYYLDAEVVENAKAGDTITIQDIPYTLQKIEKSEGGEGYSVELTSDEEPDWENGICVYEDIYMFAPSADGKHYSIIYCSDDTITEQIYTGSVYIAKDAVINTFAGETIKDITVSDYFATVEYPYISTWGFEVNEEGLISYIQNQLAG